MLGPSQFKPSHSFYSIFAFTISGHHHRCAGLRCRTTMLNNLSIDFSEPCFYLPYLVLCGQLVLNHLSRYTKYLIISSIWHMTRETGWSFCYFPPQVISSCILIGHYFGAWNLNDQIIHLAFHPPDPSVAIVQLARRALALNMANLTPHKFSNILSKVSPEYF